MIGVKMRQDHVVQIFVTDTDAGQLAQRIRTAVHQDQTAVIALQEKMGIIVLRICDGGCRAENNQPGHNHPYPTNGCSPYIA